MDVTLIQALNDYYQFDLEAEQADVLDHLRQALHVDERTAALAMAELIASDYLTVIAGRSHGADGYRTRALVRPGPKLSAYAAQVG